MLSQVHLFPVRHHSPRTSLVLEAFLEQVKPRAVLVEGPSDADGLIDLVVDPQTRPPVAILGYPTDGTPASVLYPLASYSPEYVALRWARSQGALARFIDISVGQSLAFEHAGEEKLGDRPPAAELGEAPAPAGALPRLEQRIAQARGFRSFEELWEASFEAPRYQPGPFREALLAYAALVVADPTADRSFHRARDAYMTARIAEVVASGVPADQVVVVLGAAHAAAMVAQDVDPSLEATLLAAVPSAATLIPYSYPRLAEQTGYGAGNRAPHYYQRAWEAKGDFRRATLEVLLELSGHLRLRGFSASLADTLEAYRLACMLATLRHKAEPGLDEVREATVATLCRGDNSHVDGFLWPSVVGKHIGQVAARIGKNSLQQEFWREVEERRLPRTDAPESFVLKLNEPVQMETSVFLHRLRVARVPYANFQGTQGGRGSGADEAGGYAALSRVREGWEAQWTPATDVGLVERITLGNTLQRACERVLGDRLSQARSTGDAAEVLLESVVTFAPEALHRALMALDGYSAHDDDLPSLARAARALSGLVAYGSSREGTRFAADALPALCVKTFERAVLRVLPASAGTDEAVEPVKEALRTLHEVAVGQPLVAGADWFEAAQDLVDSDAVNPTCSGLALGLLYLAQQVDEARVTVVVSQRLSNHLEPAAAAGFLQGFLEVNALVLAKSRPVVEALDAFLTSIPADRFTDALPMLRRALGPLGATERRYLLENLLAVRKLGHKARAAAEVIAEKDKEKLAAMSADVAKAMDDLDDLL